MKKKKHIKSSKKLTKKTEVIKVRPVRMRKSDITFDFMAPTQLREEAPKNGSLKGPITLKLPYNFSELYQSGIVLAE